MDRLTVLPSTDDTDGDRADPPASELDLVRMHEDLNTRAHQLGGRWDFSRAMLAPSETTLNAHARRMQIATLPRWSLRLIAVIYYPMVTMLAMAYSWLVAELQAWEPPLAWIGGGALALAFWGASLLVLKLWKYAAIARYREDKPGTALWTALAGTGAAVVIDYCASYMLLSASLRESFLGLSAVPEMVVYLLAGLTTLAQLLGAFYGWNLGLRHEAATSWWDWVTRDRESELDQFRRAAFAIERRRAEGHIERKHRRPRAHVANDR
jgi:hypothetical protein